MCFYLVGRRDVGLFLFFISGAQTAGRNHLLVLRKGA
nr:MAG TPA: hypothetical protein [Microviridae sp.]